MKKVFLIMVACLCTHTANAQQLAAKGKTIESIVPNGWTIEKVTGDMNKDGIDDLALIVTPNDRAHIEVRESDGYEYNYNAPILAIYWGNANGEYTRWKQYKDILSHRTDEFTSVDYMLTITPKGVLTINIDPFASAGGWENSNTTYVYRYQNNDMYLIGKDYNAVIRNTGKTETISENYLSNKKQVVTGSIDSDAKKEKWSALPKKALKRLGTFVME